MRVLAALGAALALFCISAAESPSNYVTYDGVPVANNPNVLPRFDSALRRCVPEASDVNWSRGSTNPYSLQYNSILRNCLYRYRFVDRGFYAYPATQIFDHFFDR
ncbi:hypothetical protein [Rhizobium sp. BK251]|uniref:hypothetical protein n=1 Tax=Rhizobium sp. BK251 TaxID=2512125 RepID=UPI00104D4C50|nr:hypothetical protein [Rhizobium sp. BK251]TCL73846.1 hypothetical protein EV286_103380 [Rhizobium sp. BK251]